MIKNFLFGFCLLCHLAIMAQEKVIIGKITDSIGNPLICVSICQTDNNNCTHSDNNGLFHLLIDERYSPQMRIVCVGYSTITISGLDTISDLLKVIMTIDTISEEAIKIEEYETYPNRTLRYGFISFLQADFIYNNFGDFRPLLKDYNVELMNKSSGIFSLELAGTYKRYYAGINWGFADNYIYDHDSLDIEFHTNQFGLHFGYNLLNTKRLLFYPKVAVKWNRYRLLNNDKDKTIPVEQYVNERDLDLRFNQMTGFVGFNLSYKMYLYNLWPTDYWTFGIYGGYAFKLNDKPWIYSRGNRLTSSGKIEMDNYNIGIHFSFNFNGQ